VPQGISREPPKVHVPPGVIAHLEQRISDDLSRPLLVVLNPFPAAKKRCLGTCFAQVIYYGTLIAGLLVRLLAKIKSERDLPHALWKFHAANNPSPFFRNIHHLCPLGGEFDVCAIEVLTNLVIAPHAGE